MSIWIGDIGGSSSRWGVLGRGPGEILPGSFPGFNPLTGDPGPLQARLRGAWQVTGGEGPAEVFAYGAGCGSQVRAARMRQVLAEVWPEARIDVQTDLLGAARSVYGSKPGLVLILGTGMNAGHYDGGFMHTPMPSLGYILGDEGSGADIGKHLLRDALYGLVPTRISGALFPQGMDLGAVLSEVYRSTAAQAYVASFTAALAGHRHEHYVHDLVASRFFALARLLERFFAEDERREVKAVGAVAHGFRDLLQMALGREGMLLTAVERDPLPGLLAFHRP